MVAPQTFSPPHKPFQPTFEDKNVFCVSSLPPLPSPIAPATQAEGRALGFDYRVAPFGVQFLSGDSCAFKVGTNEQVTVRATQTLTAAMGPVEWTIHIDNHAAKTHGQSIIVGVVPRSFNAFKGPLSQGGWGYESCGRWCGDVEEEEEEVTSWSSLRSMNSLTFATGSTVHLRFDPSTDELAVSAVCKGVTLSTTRRLHRKTTKSLHDVVPAVTLSGVTDRVTCLGIRYDHVSIVQHNNEMTRVRDEAQRLMDVTRRRHAEEVEALKAELALARAGAILLNSSPTTDASAPQEQLVAAIGQLGAPMPMSTIGFGGLTDHQVEHHNTQAAIAHAEALELVDQLTRTLRRRDEAILNAKTALAKPNHSANYFLEEMPTPSTFSTAYPPLPSPAATEDWLSPMAVRSPTHTMGLPTPRAGSTCASAATSPIATRAICETIGA